MMNKTAFISLGSNLGDTFLNLSHALTYIKKIPNVLSIQSSSVYLTEPLGLKEQPWFANQVAKVTLTDVTPISFLRELLKIEKFLGRKREIRWGPRTIDLDLLLFDKEIIESEELTLPHPRLTHRAFVLIPLLEIEPEAVLPNGEKLHCCLKKIDFYIKGNKIWQKE